MSACRTAAGLAILILSAGVTASAASFRPAVDFTPDELKLGGGLVDFAGFTFQVGNDPVTVDALGVASVSIVTPGINTVEVLMQDGGVSDLRHVAFNTGNSFLSDDGRFYFVHITPLTLSANTTYLIEAEVSYAQYYTASAVFSAPGITYLEPKGPYGPAGDVFGATFEIQSPEPAMFGPLVLAGLAAFWRRRNMRGCK